MIFLQPFFLSINHQSALIGTNILFFPFSRITICIKKEKWHIECIYIYIFMNSRANDGDRHHSSTRAHLSCRRTDDADDRDARKRETLLIELILLLYSSKSCSLFNFIDHDRISFHVWPEHPHDVIYSLFPAIPDTTLTHVQKIWRGERHKCSYWPDAAIGRLLFFSRPKVCWKDIARGGHEGEAGSECTATHVTSPVVPCQQQWRLSTSPFFKRSKQKKIYFHRFQKNET